MKALTDLLEAYHIRRNNYFIEMMVSQITSWVHDPGHCDSIFTFFLTERFTHIENLQSEFVISWKLEYSLYFCEALIYINSY